MCCGGGGSGMVGRRVLFVERGFDVYSEVRDYAVC